MPKLISPEVKEKIKKLAANNYRTQGEIAKQFGVSRPTVNRLLSKKPRVRRETRKDAGVVCPITGFRFF